VQQQLERLLALPPLFTSFGLLRRLTIGVLRQSESSAELYSSINDESTSSFKCRRFKFLETAFVFLKGLKKIRIKM
jgi:hypothetical protein